MIELQGTRDLNPQPLVLETSALPVELVPSGARAEARARNEESTTTPAVIDHSVDGDDYEQAFSDSEPSSSGRSGCNWACRRDRNFSRARHSRTLAAVSVMPNWRAMASWDKS